MSLKADAEKGDAEAQFLLGFAYVNGEDVERDYREGLKCYRKAADQGSIMGQFHLALLYEEGHLGQKDYAEARKWYRKAAEQGDPKAHWAIGLMYRYGDGIEKDYVEAYAFLNLAARFEAGAGKDRDDLEKMMSSQQVGEAQKRTRELRSHFKMREIELPASK